MRPAQARCDGFTLVELLITVAIIAIVTSLAVGGYRQYVRRAARVDATSTLLRLAASEEKFYAQKGRYAGDDELQARPPEGLGFNGTERGFYALAVAPATGGLTVGFTASATVNEGGDQGDDEDCWSFTINERGLRTARDKSGRTSSQITERCWR